MERFNHQAFAWTRPYRTWMLLLPVLVAGLAAAQPGTDQTEQILARIESRAAAVTTFVADFTQKRHTKLLREPLVSEGLIYFDRNGKMLMQINRPSALKILFEDPYLTLINPEQALVYKKRLSAADRMMTMWMGFGESLTTMKQQYNARLGLAIENQGYRLTFVPQEENLARHIAAIEIRVGSDNLLPEQVVISEPGGDQTTLRLHFLSVNEPLPADIFTIERPEGFRNR